MSLYSICHIPVAVHGILKLLLGNSMWLVVCHLSWIVFIYYVKYCVSINGTSIINLYASFYFLVYVVVLNCIQVFSYVCGKYCP